MVKKSAPDIIDKNSHGSPIEKNIDVGLKSLAGQYYWTRDERGMPCVKKREENKRQ
jgi:hypothetical protein